MVRFALAVFAVAAVWLALSGTSFASPPLPRFEQLSHSIRFGTGGVYPVDYWPASSAAVDINGANGPDIVGMKLTDIFVLPNLGGGTFGAEVDVALDMRVAAFQLTDLDGDGKLDLIVAGVGSQDSLIEVRRGLGNLQFDAPVSYTLDFQPSELALADISGDGRLDLIVASRNSDSLRVFATHPSGALTPYTSVAVRVGAFVIRTGDFDSDGTQDVALLHAARYYLPRYSTGPPPDSDLVFHVTILSNDGGGLLRRVQTIDRADWVSDLSAFDADLDGHTDLVLLESGQVALLRGNGFGSFAAPEPIDNVGPAGENDRRSITHGDIDRDGFEDLIYTTIGNSYFFERNFTAIARGRGDGTYEAAATYLVPRDPELLLVSDFNRDGALDVATFAYGNDILGEFPTCALVLINHGDGRLAGRLEVDRDPAAGLGQGPSEVPGGPILGARIRAHAIPDIIVTTAGRASAVLNDGSDRFSRPIDIGRGHACAAPDLDGDGLADLVLASNDTTSTWTSNGDGHFTSLAAYVGGVETDLEDLDGDGRKDLALLVSNLQTATRAGQIDGSFGALTLLDLVLPATNSDPGYASTTVTAVRFADLDGDGLADVIAAIRKTTEFQNSVDSAAIYFNLGGGHFSGPTTYAMPQANTFCHAPVGRIKLGDLNGDGIRDIVLLHSTTSDNGGTINVLLQNSPRTFASLAPIDAGNSPENLEVADLNGDGLSDLLTVNANGFATFHFFVYEDSGGTILPYTRYRVADVASDLAVMDLDADGKPDVVTYGPRWGGSLVIDFNQSTRPATVSVLPIDSPSRAASLGLSLGNVTPNPSRGRAAITFTLPHAGDATLEVLDIAGRRVGQQHLSGLSAGPHVVAVGASSAALAPGVYLLRLEQAGQSRVSRFCVVN